VVRSLKASRVLKALEGTHRVEGARCRQAADSCRNHVCSLLELVLVEYGAQTFSNMLQVCGHGTAPWSGPPDALATHQKKSKTFFRQRPEGESAIIPDTSNTSGTAEMTAILGMCHAARVYM